MRYGVYDAAVRYKQASTPLTTSTFRREYFGVSIVF